MSKVTVTQNMEPGWSNRRSGRGEPQSPATAAAEPETPLKAAPDAPTEETQAPTPKAGKRIRPKATPKAARAKKR